MKLIVGILQLAMIPALEFLEKFDPKASCKLIPYENKGAIEAMDDENGFL